MPRLVLLLMPLIPECMSAAQESLFRDCLAQICLVLWKQPAGRCVIRSRTEAVCVQALN